MTSNQFIQLKRGQVLRYNAYNLLGMVVHSFVDRNVIHEVRVVWENGNINTYHKERSHDFSPIDPDSLI
jgi:hypothetical protein